MKPPLAGFIKAIKATDWVRQGHEHFAEKSEGKCPYCQQELPDDFEKQIAACFDGRYQEDISALRQFQEDYVSDMQGFLDVLNGNLQDAFPKLDLTEYKTKLALLEKMVEINIQRITDKLKEPSSVITLENVKTLRDEINVLIEGFNKQIQANKTLSVRSVRSKPSAPGKYGSLLHLHFKVMFRPIDYGARPLTTRLLH